MNKLEDRIAIDAHNAHLTQHFTGADDAMFRIVVRINSYHNQSSMVLSRWDGEQWQVVTSLRGHEITTWPVANGARVAKRFKAFHIDADIQTLMTEARFITGGFK